MPRIVQVAHVVPVEVLVDLDEGTVERVVVCDEEVRVDETTGFRSEGFLAPVDPESAQRALEIADCRSPHRSHREGWPEWEFGF